ncbi:MAG: hypothetical protein HY537_02180 [Deltaproteobacteria bacterium]|nr:hypothetical protein [Deltaproteobacteria bacterium]
MKDRLILMLALCLNCLNTYCLADDGTLIFEAGDSGFIVPWKICLIISACLSGLIFLARKD